MRLVKTSNKHRKWDGGAKAGPVKITKADGTVEEKPALSPAEVQKIVNPDKRGTQKHNQ